MALKKADLEGMPTKEQEEEIQALESTIDATLSEDYVPGKDVTVRFRGCLHIKVRLELQRRYRAAGWKVKFDFDPAGPCDRIALS